MARKDTMRGSRPHQVLLDEHDPQAPHGYVDLRNFWTKERWENFARRLHRQGLLQRRGHPRGALKQPPRRSQRAQKLDKGKSRQELAYDEWLADNRDSYETTTTVAIRKRIAKRHARRRARRATQRHMRRKRWGRA